MPFINGLCNRYCTYSWRQCQTRRPILLRYHWTCLYVSGHYLSDTYQLHSFLFCKCTTKKPKPKKTQTNKKPTAVILCLLTSHHTIHSICFCSHPWCKWPHWAIPAFSLSAAGGRHLQKGHGLCLCLWFHSASSTALFHLHTEDIKHLQAEYNSKLHILKCTVMIWASKSMWNTDQAHNEKRKISSHSLLVKHIRCFPFQYSIGTERRTVIQLCLDKYACPSTALCWEAFYCSSVR